MTQVYNYTAAGHYISTTTAMPDPLEPGRTLVPANATTVTPPIVGDHEVAKWMGTAWAIVGDFRGDWYDLDTQSHTKIWYPEEPAPANATEVAPPADHPTWAFTGTVWERTLAVAKAEKQVELLTASSDARDVPLEFDGHFYSTSDRFMLFLWAALESQGQVEVYDVESEVYSMPIPQVRNLLQALQAAAVAIEVNYARKFTAVHVASDIPTVDGISW